MSIVRTILIKSLVKPYYRQNAGLFVFVYFIMILAVGRANEAGLLEYHYSLIKGMLINPVIFMLVLFVWFLYAKKCEQFVLHTFQRHEFEFLNMLPLTNPARAYGLLLQIQLILFLPVSLYVLVILGVGIYKHWYLQVILVFFYILALCLASARFYLHLLKNPATRSVIRWRMHFPILNRFYWYLLIRYVLTSRKLLFFVIKIYGCTILYLMLVNLTPVEYDLRMILLFYSFGLLGHGVIIHQLRAMEETRMTFYRGLPVSLFSRWAQYGWLYFFLFIPEIMTIGWMAPGHLHYNDALLFVFFGFSVLLLLNSLLFVKYLKMADYLKLIVVIFFIIYIGVLTGILLWLSVFSFTVSICIFFSRYYQYER
jgi:hypothetical protein